MMKKIEILGKWYPPDNDLEKELSIIHIKNLWKKKSDTTEQQAN